MERILALQALSPVSNVNDAVLGSDRSVECSSETTQCSTASNNCTGATTITEMLQW
jgi:hypothetical protein